jgi:[acyl-carrier-protein] S-malonyltransferase
MGRDVYTDYPQARLIFDEADKILGFPLTQLCFEGPLETLTETINAQPAILATSIAYYMAASSHLTTNAHWTPAYVAGHSLGEYTALVAAGTLDFRDAIWLVRERGRLMHEAGEKTSGGMGVVLGMDEVTMEEICQETGTELANINSSEQIVISGTRDALARALDLAKARGAKRVIPLRVGGAFHSSLMSPALDGMTKALEQVSFSRPRVPLIANRTGKPLTDTASIKKELLDQLCGSVLWRQSVQYMTQNGVRTFLEIGPGRVLTGLVRQIESDAETINVGEASALGQLAS